MFEYHGWVTIRETATAEDGDWAEEQARLRAIVAGIEERARELSGPCLLDVRWMNGEPYLHLGGSCNHRDPGVLAFFREVGERAPGSYGVLHVRDDEDAEGAEDAEGRGNELRAHRMVRGRVAEGAEAELSPCIPVLEDPWE
ncbi:Imm7 family immunity protein [Kitasatospora sp. NPDC088391]|uniref:Imm7 family immunity protein n=1 Tax=Kitasatospora sp. NPDC088391 TaxID=3364074 RepID=UPI003824E392